MAAIPMNAISLDILKEVAFDVGKAGVIDSGEDVLIETFQDIALKDSNFTPGELTPEQRESVMGNYWIGTLQ
jgi:hypothetical protein